MGKHKLDHNDPSDRRTIIRHPTRLALARLCRRSPRTISELCDLMGMEDGALRGTVKQMKDWTVLLEAPGSNSRRRVYHFSSAWDPELAEAVRRHRPLDLLTGQRAVLLDAAPPADAQLDDVSWVLEFDGGERSLLAVADDADGSAASIRRQLQERGLEAARLEVSGHLNPAEANQPS
jgi:hypothetical protein